MKGNWIVYSREELAWLEANCTLGGSEYHRQFCELFGRDVSAKNLHGLRKRSGWRTGRTGRFEAGSVPHNRGIACPPGTGGRHPNSRRTQFKAGGRSGKAARLWKPIGTERVSKDGYRERKVHDGLPMQSRWRAVHLLEWEAANGPVPSGMALKCKGDRLNTDPSNWELVSRALLPRLNGFRTKTHLAYDDAPDELKPVILAAAKLDHAARRARKAERA